MTNLNKLRSEIEKVLMDLNEEDVEKYVRRLAFYYYKAIMQKDCKELEHTCESLRLLIYIYLARFPDIENFINYCLVISSNMVLSQVFEIDCNMWKPEDKNISSHSNLASLTRSFEISKRQYISIEDMNNIRKLQSMLYENETINDEMRDVIDKLYEKCVYEFERGETNDK